MRFDILTLFPEFFESPLRTSMMARALEGESISIHLHNIRDWTDDKHHVADDAPYGGGGGMVMKPEPVVLAVRAVRALAGGDAASGGRGAPPVIYLSPQGAPLTAALAGELASLPGIILLCGNYEGIDERALELVVDHEVSIGDYVLTGGELAALVVLNAVARKVRGVLGNADSAVNDSFENGLLDYPHYTRPEVFEDRAVPRVLIEGHHAKMTEWRRQQSLLRTAQRRPELLAQAPLDKKDWEFLSLNAGESTKGEEEDTLVETRQWELPDLLDGESTKITKGEPASEGDE